MSRGNTRWERLVKSLDFQDIPFGFIHSIRIHLSNGDINEIYDEQQFERYMNMFVLIRDPKLQILRIEFDINFRKLRKAVKKQSELILDKVFKN